MLRHSTEKEGWLRMALSLLLGHSRKWQTLLGREEEGCKEAAHHPAAEVSLSYFRGPSFGVFGRCLSRGEVWSREQMLGFWSYMFKMVERA